MRSFPTYYLSGLVAAPRVDGAAPALSFGTELDPGEVAQLIVDLQPGHDDHLVPPHREDVGAMLETLAIYRVHEGDPWELSQEAREDGLPVSPIHAMAPTVHWTFGPGERPDPVSDPPYNPQSKQPQPDRPVAVVDTGFVPTGKAWFDGNTGGDLDPDPTNDDIGGHGTFICSLIHQISARARVEMKAANPVKPSRLLSTASDHPAPPQPPPYTDEIQVNIALRALMRKAPSPYHVLNLSLGTYESMKPSDVDSPIQTVATALADWRNMFPDCHIVCAAGNEAASNYFWPAALWTLGAPFDTNFYSIDPTNCRDRVIGWVGKHPNAKRYWLPKGRAWATDRIPGVDLVGLKSGSQSVRWSGSSFATAVASALLADGKSLKGANCRNIPNLHR